MEVEAKPLYKDQPLKKDVERYMKGHGFEIRLDQVGKVSGDQLYVNTRFYPRSSLRTRALRRIGLVK